MSIQKYENYQKQVDNEVKKFRKEVKQIEESENPYYNSKAVKDYEIGLKRQELEQQVHEINNEFQKDIESDIDVAEQQAHRSKFSKFKASETVKREVDAYVDNLKSDLLLGLAENDKLKAIERFEDGLDYMDESALYYARQQLGGIAELINKDDSPKAFSKLQTINHNLSQLKTEEEEHLEALQSYKRAGIDGAFRRLKMTHSSYSDVTYNMHSQNGSI